MNLDFETVICNLIYAKEELECSKTPFLLNELLEILERIIYLDNEFEMQRSNTHSKPNLSLLKRNPLKVEKKYADFEYIIGQLEVTVIEIGHALDWWEDEWLWVNDELDVIIDSFINLQDDFIAIKRLVDIISEYNPIEKFYDLLAVYNPGYREIIQQIKKLNLPIKNFQYIPDPTQKELPRPKRGSYRRSRQTFTTYSTGSKAMLVLQGTHLKADRSHLPLR
ncbi:hypothetical protein RCG23_13915 [Neobacillus sp. PS3-34]|uniref:hypothetical protein n=1 Tax=Neobacillus sp. PS3-34 TaxID=3070678 RepID=UPI0027DFB4ED|nr:hypothetical protein [Neobacillus sp. PS3-34]WML46738.1 hypothetical protein RCG23_13915 [Neobacillus sp. PS3-34]